MLKKITSVLALIGATLVPTMTSAQSCASVEIVTTELELEYGETVVAAGFDQQGFRIEIWLNEETGTWSMVGYPGSNPDVACVIVHGGEMAIIRE